VTQDQNRESRRRADVQQRVAVTSNCGDIKRLSQCHKMSKDLVSDNNNLKETLVPMDRQNAVASWFAVRLPHRPKYLHPGLVPLQD
jgi:hypothetical protein